MNTDDETMEGTLPPELRQLRAAVPVEDPALVAARRARMVKALGEEISRASASQRRRRRLGRFAWVSAAAAMLALSIGSGVLVLHRTSPNGAVVAKNAAPATPSPTTSPKRVVDAAPTARVLRSTGDTVTSLAGPDQTLSAGTLELHTGTRVRTQGNGWLALELPGLSQLEVSGSTQVRLAALTAWNQRLELSRGRIDVSIPKDPNRPPHHLLVVTPDSEVEVRGTVFSVVVEPSPQDPTRLVTEVFVARGAVAVRRSNETGKDELLTVGRRWRSDEERATDAPESAATEAAHSDARLISGSAQAGRSPAESAPTRASSSQRGDSERSVSAGSPKGSRALETATADELVAEVAQPTKGKGTQASLAEAESTLGAQNRLFERALASRDRGALAEAVRALDLLVERYPDSPLYTSARTERARIIDRMKRDAASGN